MNKYQVVLTVEADNPTQAVLFAGDPDRGIGRVQDTCTVSCGNFSWDLPFADPDHLTAAVLANRYSGSKTHPVYTREMWRQAVAAANTDDGYIDWLLANLRAAARV